MLIMHVLLGKEFLNYSTHIEFAELERIPLPCVGVLGNEFSRFRISVGHVCAIFMRIDLKL